MGVTHTQASLVPLTTPYIIPCGYPHGIIEGGELEKIMKRVLGQYMSHNMSERIIVSAIMQQLDVGMLFVEIFFQMFSR